MKIDIMIIPADPRYPLAKQPLITNEMKSECIGEFKYEVTRTCSACYFHGTDNDCEVCSGEVHYEESMVVPWDIVKEIYKKMAVVAANP